MSAKKKQIWVENPEWEPWSHAEKRLLPQLQVNVWGFIAMLLLRNKTNNSLASFATCLSRQRSGHERTTISSLHVCTNWPHTTRTVVHGHPQLSPKCRQSNHISFDVFDRCCCKVETRAYEMPRSCGKRLGGFAITT